MNKVLIFLIIALASLLFSIITILNSPIINKIVGSDWGIQNCQKYHDAYEFNKEAGNTDDINKKNFHKWNREKAMYGLEYSSLIIDIILGMVCIILGLFAYFDIFKNFGKKIGIIGLSSGVICFILTLVYTCYSGYIFNNDPSDQQKVEDNGIFAEWNDIEEEFKCKFLNNDDIYESYAKYKDLGKKQYNYNRDYHFLKEGEEIYQCSMDIIFKEFDNDNDYSPQDFCSGNVNFIFDRPTYYDDNDVEKDCNYLYYWGGNDYSNKYKYDRWITSIIFSVLIIVSELGIILFGFLLFKE